MVYNCNGATNVIVKYVYECSTQHNVYQVVYMTQTHVRAHTQHVCKENINA